MIPDPSHFRACFCSSPEGPGSVHLVWCFPERVRLRDSKCTWSTSTLVVLPPEWYGYQWNVPRERSPNIFIFRKYFSRQTFFAKKIWTFFRFFRKKFSFFGKWFKIFQNFVSKIENFQNFDFFGTFQKFSLKIWTNKIFLFFSRKSFDLEKYLKKTFFWN